MKPIGASPSVSEDELSGNLRWKMVEELLKQFDASVQSAGDTAYCIKAAGLFVWVEHRGEAAAQGPFWRDDVLTTWPSLISYRICYTSKLFIFKLSKTFSPKAHRLKRHRLLIFVRLHKAPSGDTKGSKKFHIQQCFLNFSVKLVEYLSGCRKYKL